MPPDAPAVLLTDAEVAERLRCSKQTVAKLRLHGRLPYMPGRPPLIAKADLTTYLEQASHETASRVIKRNRIVEPENGIAAARLRARRD